MGVTRWLWIYTPPGYDQSRDSYPVLYLLHGNGEAQNGWVMNGRANIILDNGIAEGRVAPMIVVMPQGHALQGANVGPLVRLAGETSMFSPRFPRDLLEDVVPLVERKYRAKKGPEHRAIAGLSMGGGQALSIGLANPKVFSYVLGFSAAVGGQFLDMKDVLPEAGAPSVAVVPPGVAVVRPAGLPLQGQPGIRGSRAAARRRPDLPGDRRRARVERLAAQPARQPAAAVQVTPHTAHPRSTFRRVALQACQYKHFYIDLYRGLCSCSAKIGPRELHKLSRCNVRFACRTHPAGTRRSEQRGRQRDV